MAIHNGLQLKQALVNETKYARGGSVALLSECPKDGHLAVSIHFDDTVTKCVKHGSSSAPLRNKCKGTCEETLRLHSFTRSHVLAEVDAFKHRQVSDMKTLADQMNYMNTFEYTSQYNNPKNEVRTNNDKGCGTYECRNVKGHDIACITKHYLLQLGDVKDFTEASLKGKTPMPMKRWEKRLRGGY